MTDITRAETNDSSKQGTGKTPARIDEAAHALRSNLAADAQQVGQGIVHLASDVADQTKKAASSQIDLGMARAGEGLGSVASALRKTGESLRADDEHFLDGVIDGAAQRVDSAAHYLRDRSVTDVLGDVKEFARREPALFLGGALVLGLFGGRFLKASTPTAASMPGASTKGPNGNGSTNAKSANANRSGSGSTGRGQPMKASAAKMSTGERPPVKGEDERSEQDAAKKERKDAEKADKTSAKPDGAKGQEPSPGTGST